MVASVMELDREWRTERLDLEPLVAEHAAELAPLLDDAALHEFTGGAPVGGVTVADADAASARGLAVAARAAAKPQPPKKPRILYRWKDSRGVLHMTETPPSDGAYETLRSSD